VTERKVTLGILVALYAGVMMLGVALDPEQMPLHWGLDGEPNRVGSTEQWLAETAILGAAILAIGAVLGLLVRRFPGSVNIPNKDYWLRPEHVDEARERALTSSFDIFGDAFLLVTVIELVAVLRANRGDLDFPVWLFAVLLAGFLVSVGWRVVRMRREFAVPTGRR
jgi:uncharacterized membrane protein